MRGRRRGYSSSEDDLTLDELILTRDWVRLRTLQLRAEPLPPIPAGAIGKVLKTGPEGALVRFQKFGSTVAKFDDLERASFIDMVPVRAQPLVGRLGGWVVTTTGALILVVLTVIITKVITGK